MYEIRIPDHVYRQVSEAAEANHVSLEEFVIEALQLHVRDEEPSVQLSSEQVAIIRQAQAEVRAGQGLTSEQARAEFAVQRAKLLKMDEH